MDKTNNTTNDDVLHGWEKWPIGAVFTAQGLYVFAWYVGAQMPGAVEAVLPWLYVIGGVAAWVAIDGSMVATVMGMRAGRRSPWSVAAILVTAAFGAGLALDLYDALPFGAAWLHAGFAATIVCYLMHLAAPRVGTRAKDYAEKLARAEAELAQAAQSTARLAAEVAQANDRAAQAEALMARAAEDVARTRDDLGTAMAEAEALAAQRAVELAQVRRELARRPQEDGAAWLTYNGQRVTLAQLVEATGTPSATLRRKLARVAETTAQAAD